MRYIYYCLRFASNWPLHWSAVSLSSTCTNRTSSLTSTDTVYSTSLKTQGALTDHCSSDMMQSGSWRQIQASNSAMTVVVQSSQQLTLLHFPPKFCALAPISNHNISEFIHKLSFKLILLQLHKSQNKKTVCPFCGVPLILVAVLACSFLVDIVCCRGSSRLSFHQTQYEYREEQMFYLNLLHSHTRRYLIDLPR